MTAKEQLAALSARLRTSADLYRYKANDQDKHACYVDVLAALDEPEAKTALDAIVVSLPGWFPS